MIGFGNISSIGGTANRMMITTLNTRLNEDSIRILKFRLSECLENCDSTSRIVSQSLTDSTFSLRLAVHFSCIGNVESKIEARKDTMDIRIYLIPNEFGITKEEACGCFYYIDYNLVGITKIPNEILINGETLKENLERYTGTDKNITLTGIDQ